MKSVLSGLTGDLNITSGSGSFLFQKGVGVLKVQDITTGVVRWACPPKVFKVQNPELLFFLLYGKILQNSQCQKRRFFFKCLQICRTTIVFYPEQYST